MMQIQGRVPAFEIPGDVCSGVARLVVAARVFGARVARVLDSIKRLFWRKVVLRPIHVGGSYVGSLQVVVWAGKSMSWVSEWS